MRQPLISHAWTPFARPCTWKSGSHARYRSLDTIFHDDATAIPLAARAACDNTAPLAAPVVPDVYTIRAALSAPSTGQRRLVRSPSCAAAAERSVSIGHCATALG